MLQACFGAPFELEGRESTGLNRVLQGGDMCCGVCQIAPVAALCCLHGSLFPALSVHLRRIVKILKKMKAGRARRPVGHSMLL